MDGNRFKQILRSFLDSRDHLQFEKGTLVMQFGGDLINGTLLNKDGMLFVTEADGKACTAEEWIIRRIAMLDLLADRILSTMYETVAFVPPRGDFLDELNRSPNDQAVEVKDAMGTVHQFLERRPGGTCSVLYLTSDAGEGKTTVINQLSRIQAERFRKRESDWLLVPISLGGRPFLRFDDVVVAALMNQLRFQRLYFDAFIQLVRMGVLIPALDGFEEIFVETSEGDAVSSLGTLIRKLEGEGTLLIAARRAYFEFRRLQTQARLLDTLPDLDVTFGRVGLRRWSKDQFIYYCHLNQLGDADQFYEQVSQQVPPDHPLLTRPILIRRLVQLAQNSDRSFVKNLRPHTNRYFTWLVDQVLEREAQEKWIDKHGEPPKPLLTVDQHHRLLGFVAEEMWISKTSVVSAEMLDSIAELFCESQHLSPIISRQVKERIKQHALIVAASTLNIQFEFDHEHFREFFLGEELAEHMLRGREADIRKLFRIELLPTVALDSATVKVQDATIDAGPVISLVLKVGLSEGSSTFVRENAGAVISRLLGCEISTPTEIEGLVFPTDALAGHHLCCLTFKNCYFRPTSLDQTTLRDCRFISCEFEQLILVEKTLQVEGGVWSEDTRVDALSVKRQDETSDFYDPSEIAVILSRAGIPVPKQEQFDFGKPTDKDLQITELAFQAFHRSTYVSESTFRARLGRSGERFISYILPALVKANILQEVDKHRFKLGTSLANIATALRNAKGSFAEFVASFSTRYVRR